MKPFLFFFFSLVFCTVANAQRDTVLFSKNDIDFGTIKGVASKKEQVWLYNKGKNPLTIKNIVWGVDYCPCLYVKNLTVAPGDSFLITIQCIRMSTDTTFSRSMSVNTSLGMYKVNYKGEFMKEEKKPVPPKPKEK